MKKKISRVFLLLTTFLPIVSVSASCKVSCGNVTDIPYKIPELTSLIITIVQIAVPVILVIMGSIDLVKGISSQKEDELKKGQKMLIKRLIVAAVIFFVIVIVKLLISLVSNETNSANIIDCMDCFLSGSCTGDSACK